MSDAPVGYGLAHTAGYVNLEKIVLGLRISGLRCEKEKCNSTKNMPLHKKYADNDNDKENDKEYINDNDNISTISSPSARYGEGSGVYSEDFLEFRRAYQKN